MPLVSIPAVFDGTTVKLLETAPYHEPYRVMVTFVAPVAAATDTPVDLLEPAASRLISIRAERRVSRWL